MRLVPAVIFTVLLSTTTLAQNQSIDIDNDKFNSIDPKPSVRLDPYIRKALLKALSELEQSDGVTTDTDVTEESSTVDSAFLSETLQPPLPKEEIKIHSFVVNGQEAFANSTYNTPTVIDNKISILSTTAGNVENHVSATLPTQTPFSEIFQTRESGINVQQVRSVQTTSNTKSDSNKIPTLKPTTTTRSTTTTTTTTTTTPKPTHNDDGENIEDVDKRDVQVFQAPLVAAFTVHQDSQGLPKKVIPIFQQTSGQDPLKSLTGTSLHSPVIPQQFAKRPSPIPHFGQNNIPQQDFVSQQVFLQKQLEEKQRVLEEQLRLLQLQQRQQEELLRKQHFLLQQKEAQRQQQLIFEQEQLKRQQLIAEQQKLQANHAANTFQTQGLPKNTPPNQFLIQNTGRPQNSQVTILPSVSLEQNNLVANQQQLPNREAVDFLIHLRTQQPEQFPLQENHLPQGISNFLQPNPIQNFHQGPNPNQLRGLGDQFGPTKQGPRVFRQESGVGNFGFNNQNQNYNRFNTFNPINSNRFFPSNRQNQFSPDAELKQLLVQTGLNGRSHEDLNIVTKVLSLNHGIPINNNISNRLPFDSRRHVRTTS